MLLARLALYLTLGWILSNALECHIDSWQFWCIMALFWAAEASTRIDTVRTLESELRVEIARLLELRREQERRGQDQV